MKFFKLVGVAVTMAAMAGCISVEKTRAQLQSGDKSEIKRAEETIYFVATQNFQPETQIEYVSLTSNEELLLRILKSGWSDEVRAEALRRIKFENPETAKQFVNAFKEKEGIAKSDAMKKAIKCLKEDVLINDIWHDTLHCDKAVMHMCSERLAEIGTNTRVLEEILRSNDFHATQETRAKAAARIVGIGDDKAVLSAVYEDKDSVLPNLNDADLCRLVLSDKWGQVCNVGSREELTEKMLGRISDVTMLFKIASETKDAWVGEMALKKVDPAKLAGAVKTASPDVRALILSSTRDQNVILEVLKVDPALADESIAKKIISPKVAEYLLDHADFSKLKSRTEYTYGVRMEYPDSYQAALIISAIIKRLSPEKVTSLADEAVKRAEAKKDSAIVLGGYYLGMPALDFFVLSRVRKVNPDWGSKTITQEKDWRQRFVVDSFEFKAKDRVAVLDCEDSLVLQQIIHQCVKHEKGKAKSYDYLTEINHDIKLEKSWDGKKLEGSLWEEYVNTKLNAKIRYNKAEGKLVFTER